MEKRVPLPLVSSDQSALETRTQQPLRIRGHHLDHFKFFYGSILKGDKITASEYAQDVAGDIACADPKYARDVLGQTPPEGKRFVEQTTSIYEKFIKLPDDHPLELVEGQPDDICGACVTGSHCLQLYPNGGLCNIAMEDGMAIDELIGYAELAQKYYDKKVTLSVREEMAKFTDARQQLVRRTSTTVGSIRMIMAYILN